MESRGKRILNLALKEVNLDEKESDEENKVPDSENESDTSCLFGDNSSDEYQPDYEELSDSDPDFLVESSPIKEKRIGHSTEDIVINPSDEDEVSSVFVAVNDSENASEDDFVGPSDDDDENNRPIRSQTSGPTKKKHFSPKDNTSRKRKRNPDEWKKRKAAVARQKGKAYINYKGQEVQAKSAPTQELCSQKCRLKCSEKFSVPDREAIFSQFYKLDINAKNSLLFGSIKIRSVQRLRKGAKKHKTASFKYVITFNGKQTFVCKTGFAKMFSIGMKKIDLIQKSIKNGLSAPELDKRGKHNSRPHKLADDVKEYIKQHIAQFPAEDSHYSRSKNLNKKYLSPLLSIAKMHKLYLEKCAEDNVGCKFYVKECTYRKVFVSEFNLSFGYPKSDTCSTCDAGDSNDMHVACYKEAYAALKADRNNAQTSEKLVYMTMDLQQTMPLPRLSTSKAFYLRQLWMYNFGTHITTNKSDKAVFCSWTEDQASRGSREIFSCLLTVLELEEAVKEKDHLVIWSDSCAGQNKNFLLICLYQYLIQKGMFKVIDHKFPEVGHTYLDSDRDFGRIEKNLRKHQNIYSPDDYRDIIVKSCSKNKIIDMTQHFRDTDSLERDLKLYNRKKDVNKNKVQFRDSVKWIRVEEYGSYLFKTNYDENTPFQKVDIYHKLKNEKPNLDEPVIITRSTRKTGSLKQPKVENLKEQMIFIPEHRRWWYQQILNDYQ